MHISSIRRLAFSVALFGMASTVFAQDANKQPAPPATPAYMVAEFKLNDPEAIKPYRDQVESTFKAYGGKFIARGGAVDVKEGAAPNGWVVITRFDSLAQAKAWYESPTYQNILPIRLRAGTSRVYFIEGLPGQ